MIEVIAICGYDPQLLLEDKRSPWRRFYAPDWTTHPDDDFSLMMPRESTWGTVTGRWRSRGPEAQRIPVLPPGDRIEFTSVDYAAIEARTFRKANLGYQYQMGGRSFREAIEANARFEQAMSQHRAMLKAQIDARVFEAMLSVYASVSPVDDRIARLLGSRDPRQRKRGKRLWSEGKRAPTWKVERHDHLKDWCDTALGEPYDPAKYQKD